jgi:hypothetical protein
MQQWEHLEVTVSKGIGGSTFFVNVRRGRIQSVGESFQRGISKIDTNLDPTKSVKIHAGGIEIKNILPVELLDLLGAEGWSLVTIQEERFYLKRPIGGQ